MAREPQVVDMGIPLAFSVGDAIREIRGAIQRLGLPLTYYVYAPCSMNMAGPLGQRVRAEMGGSVKLYPQGDITPVFDHDTIRVSIPANPMDELRPKLPTGGTGLMCGHCSRHHLGVCSRVLEIEYYPDGSVKMAKYDPGWVPPSDVVAGKPK